MVSPRCSKSRQNPSNEKDMVILVYNCVGVILTHTNAPIILHDNARPHVALAATYLFDLWGWKGLYDPPYSPDLSPCDFDLIPKMKEPLRVIRFQTGPDIIAAVDRSIRTLNRTGAATSILRLPHR
ncbi:mariner Mos1 transposase [Trichonephila clavipes]|nr:mariner Mos1 transposase [Trichonephila clavipes]